MKRTPSSRMRWQLIGSKSVGRSPASGVPNFRCVGSSPVSPISRSLTSVGRARGVHGHHAAPCPSIVPSPVIAMSLASRP
jgi:hypothetical protein